MKLSEIADIILGQSPNSDTYNLEKNGIPFFQGNADFGLMFPTERVYCSKPIKIVQAGDVLLSVRAPIGAVNIANQKCCIGRGLAAIRPKKNISCTKYLYYLLIGRSVKLSDYGTGSTFKAINGKTLSALEIPAYDITQQKIIVAKLQYVDDLLTNRRTQLEKLDLFIKAKFVEMFGTCKTNTKEWNLFRLSEIADIGSSKRVFVDDLTKAGVPFYRGTEIGMLAEGKEAQPALFISEKHYQSLVSITGKPQYGDLLMPSICPDGRIWLVNNSEPFYFKDGRVLWVHLNNNKSNPVFIKYALKDKFENDYSSIASGTTFAELKIFALKECSIFDVPLELQNEFALFVEQTENIKSKIKQSLEKLEILKQSLLQKYFG